MAELAAIRPIRKLECIRAPVLLFHKRGDTTVPFGQSVRLHEELERRGMAVEFRTGEGTHGFRPEEEADLYAELGKLFQGMPFPRGQ